MTIGSPAGSVSFRHLLVWPGGGEATSWALCSLPLPQVILCFVCQLFPENTRSPYLCWFRVSTLLPLHVETYSHPVLTNTLAIDVRALQRRS